MQDLIASYLIQKKECHLPLLGHFVIQQVPALLDVANKKIIPTNEEVIFSENENYISDELKNYISHLQHIPVYEAEEKINNWCLHTKMKLDAGEVIVLNAVGTLQKNDSGNILFEKEQAVHFYEPVIAERIIHKNAEHAVLVGDKETTSVVMNEFYKDDAVIQHKSSWKMWGLILLIIGLLLLLLHFYDNPFSTDGVGNQSELPLPQASSTYHVVK